MAKNKAQQPLQRFTFFLLKKSITDFTEALRDEALEPIHLQTGMTFTGQLYIPAADPKEPVWLKFLRTGVAGRLPAMSQTSLAAVLFIKTSGRIFAFTFGYGRHLLKPAAFERRFGLKVVVNRVQKDKIGTIDLKKFEEVVVKRREEMSHDTDLRKFGINVRQDMLRAVAGVPTGTTLDGLPGKSVERIQGSDSLVVFARITFKQLGHLCRGALAAYEDTIYRQRGFKWIDNLSPVEDPAKREELDQLLIAALKAKRLSTIEMTLPDEVDSSSLSGLKYSDGNELYVPQPDVGQWYESIKDDVAQLTPDKLKSKTIRLYGADGDAQVDLVSAYECLNFEPDSDDNARFLLANGGWFEVSKSYGDEIADFIKEISAAKVDLPDAQPDEDEVKYIARVEKLKKHCCMHTKTFMADGSPIEACDFLSANGQMIHLKLWTASATFSHLLSQGAVAAEVLQLRPEYRKSVYNHLLKEKDATAKLFSVDEFLPKNLQVVFGLIRSSAKQLPFFSRLNLMRNCERIQLMGYQVVYKRIRNDMGTISQPADMVLSAAEYDRARYSTILRCDS